MEAITVPDLAARPFGFTVERSMASSPDVLFAAWTERFDEWFAAPGTLVMKAEVNAVFFFEKVFKTEEDSVEQRHPHYGRFLQLIPDRLIEFTWVTGAGGTEGAETVVTIELEPRENGTYLSLTHKGFPHEKSQSRHDSAWGMILECGFLHQDPSTVIVPSSINKNLAHIPARFLSLYALCVSLFSFFP